MMPDGMGKFVAKSDSDSQEDGLLIVSRPMIDNVTECVEVVSMELHPWTVYNLGNTRACAEICHGIELEPVLVKFIKLEPQISWQGGIKRFSCHQMSCFSGFICRWSKIIRSLLLKILKFPMKDMVVERQGGRLPSKLRSNFQSR